MIDKIQFSLVPVAGNDIVKTYTLRARHQVYRAVSAGFLLIRSVNTFLSDSNRTQELPIFAD